MSDRRLSIGIAGGGIAGLYCAWKLAQQGHRVTVFECLNRVGGRIETLDLDGFKAECGPMRFELATQPLLKELGQQLGVGFADFSAPQGEERARFPRYDLDASEKSERQLNAEAAARDTVRLPPEHQDLFEFSYETSALDLLRLAIYRILRPTERHLTLRDVVTPAEGKPALIARFADEWHEAPDGDLQRHCDRIRQDFRLDGQDGPHLHRIGFWNALARVLSAGAIAKLRDTGTFYHLMPENPSASEWSIFWLRLFRSRADLSTVPTGVDSLVKKLGAEILGVSDDPTLSVEILLETAVVGVVARAGTHQVALEYDRPKRSRARRVFDHVILALPQMPLRKLSATFPDDIGRFIEGVNAFPLTKVFVTFKKRWWQGQPRPQTGAHVVPTREVHYFTPPDPGDPSGMVMLYTDRPATTYWQPFVDESHSSAQKDRPQALRDELVQEVFKELLRYVCERAWARMAQAVTMVDESVTVRAEDPVTHEELRLRFHRTRQLLTDDAPGAWRELSWLKSFMGDSPFGHELATMPDDRRLREAIEQNIASFAIRDWSRAPFGAAAHAWEPGVDVPAVLERLKAFGLRDDEGADNVHVCGEAYSNYQGFIEGALRTAEDVVAAIGRPAARAARPGAARRAAAPPQPRRTAPREKSHASAHARRGR